MLMPLSRRFAIPLGLTCVGIGLLLVFLGFSLVQKCSYLRGCQPEPDVPLVALGTGLGLVRGGRALCCSPAEAESGLT